MDNKVLKIIKENNLMVSPTTNGKWGAGVFQGVTLAHPGLDILEEYNKGIRGFSGGRYCVPGTWKEANTLEEAVNMVIETQNETN